MTPSNRVWGLFAHRGAAAGGIGEGVEVANDGVDSVAGTVETEGDVAGGELIENEGTEDFVAALAGMGGLSEEGAGTGGSVAVLAGIMQHVRNTIDITETRLLEPE